VQPPKSDFDLAASEYDALVGIVVLQNFVVTFDYDRRFVIFETN